ncbi:CxxxxCH/CxxCH domain-containing protein [Geobacter sp. AOG1]|uniref:CxxxxCH/CxxCH domain c-type cytochrome n=1 Tax=Geobacter sp. AOG1 TaxID=1566346 RepID=UPI001CC53BD4|nr:CxxxxCH/CxxCH domain-containing protein [Geobacter sp. AOG1]GFE56445.1 cytochrome c [Geobacter sp. AOG1]
MKRRFAYTLGAVALVLLATTAALAIDAPHNYNCTVCHVTHRNLGTKGTNNICFACHNQSNPQTVHKFQQTDLANPYGTTAMGTYTSGKGKQTSHNWAAPDRVPAAAATPPTNLNMNTPSSITGTVSCARCHSIHVGYADYTGTNPKRSKPLLRMRNDQDQMCMDCHTSRNQTTSTQGTHPVNFAYSDASRGPTTKPNNYYSQPINNATNPTANMKLVNGLVLCSTCHAPHFADSNASTFDNNSSAVMGRLSSSKGLLLRTNLRGKTVTDSNICVNCHKSADNPANSLASMRNHNGAKNQNIQCADCHGGHVDYDPLGDPNGIKNVFLINRYMNVSTQYGAVRNVRVLYQYTSAALKNFNKSTGGGVCLACHSPLPNTVADHQYENANECLKCHSHSQGFSANCTSCHGYPPVQNVAKGPSGYAVDGPRDYSLSGVFKNESQTPHGAHAAGGTGYNFGCIECHKGNSHNNGNFQQVFITKTGIIASDGGVANPTYNPAAYTNAGSCTTTYCHSNGNPAGVGIAYPASAPRWAAGAGTIMGLSGAARCGSCHAATPATNAHTKHAAGGAGNEAYGCVICHAATVSDNTTLLATARQSGGTHVNMVKDVLFSGAVGANALSGASCSAIYCHSNGGAASTTGVAAVYSNPVWTTPSTGQCNSCHATNALATNGHTAHLTATYGPNFNTSALPVNCQNCHTTYVNETSAPHVSGTIDYAATACTTCHPTAGTYVWNTGRVTCQSCHSGATLSIIGGATAPYKDSAVFTSGGHGQYPASNTCQSCHDANKAHISSVALADPKRLLAANDNNLCTTCHNANAPASKQVPTHVIAKNGSEESNPTMDCKVCHDVHGTTFSKMVRAKIKFGALSSTTINYNGSNFVQLTPPYKGLCQVCHTLTTHYRNGVDEGTNHPTTNCLGCHAHKDTYAFKPKACDQCHGYPPVPSTELAGKRIQGNYTSARAEDYDTGGGVHARAGHIKKTARPSEGWANCTVCHANGSMAPTTHIIAVPAPYTPLQRDITIDVDDSYKFNAGTVLDRTKYSGPLNSTSTTGTTAGSCSNVSCHFKPTPVWAP